MSTSRIALAQVLRAWAEWTGEHTAGWCRTLVRSRQRFRELPRQSAAPPTAGDGDAFVMQQIGGVLVSMGLAGPREVTEAGQTLLADLDAHERGAHLWEVSHPYYCNQGNYFSGDCGNEYVTWALFLEEEGESDFDMNLLFRWDWSAENKTLLLFWMGQRKGLYRYTVIRGMVAEDEPSVRAWLEKRWSHMLSLWTPIASVQEGP